MGGLAPNFAFLNKNFPTRKRFTDNSVTDSPKFRKRAIVPFSRAPGESGVKLERVRTA